MTFGSLFAGIGGMDLGLERAGMECKWQVEIDPFCQKVLAKHWPEVKRYGDIRTVAGEQIGWVDLIAGGFPCQDLSVAGRRAGIDGERSGLWSQFARIIGIVRPRFVLIENVPGILANEPMRRVLGDLSSLGFHAEWESISAASIGAPHIRFRVFILAYSESPKRWTLNTGKREMERHGRLQIRRKEITGRVRIGSEALAYAEGVAERPGLRQDEQGGERRRRSGAGCSEGELPHSDSSAIQPWGIGRRTAQASGSWWWATEPAVGRVAHGVPDRLDRLSGLGNAVVPQVAEWIGRRIMEVTE